MNRQQRRLAERKRKVEAKVESKIEQQMKKQKYTPKEIEVELYYTVFGLALEELMGFKAGRIRKVWKRADEYMGKIVDDELTFEEAKQLLRDRANIECSFH